MSNKRFDLTRFEDMVAEEECLNLETDERPRLYDMCDIARTLIAEIKRLHEIIDRREWTIKRLRSELRKEENNLDAWYWSSIRKDMAKKADFQGNRIESLIDALRIIRDDLDDVRADGAFTLDQSEKLRKIRNFANDASQ